jgi:hypothetical protein
VSQRWYRSGVIHSLDVRSFQDSDGDGVGDLDGLISRLDHLSRLGVTALWLNQIYSPLWAMATTTCSTTTTWTRCSGTANSAWATICRCPSERRSAADAVVGYAERGLLRCPSERLVRPVVVDDRFGSHRVNLTDQRRDPDSLLVWFERMIHTLRECSEIGTGTARCRSTTRRSSPTSLRRRAASCCSCTTSATRRPGSR